MELLVEIAKSIDRTGTQPSYRQLAKRLHYASLASIYQKLQALQSKRLVKLRGSRGVEFDWRSYRPAAQQRREVGCLGG
jgi:SOS-response transcriptional repressor LexA